MSAYQKPYVNGQQGQDAYPDLSLASKSLCYDTDKDDIKSLLSLQSKQPVSFASGTIETYSLPGYSAVPSTPYHQHTQRAPTKHFSSDNFDIQDDQTIDGEWRNEANHNIWNLSPDIDASIEQYLGQSWDLNSQKIGSCVMNPWDFYGAQTATDISSIPDNVNLPNSKVELTASNTSAEPYFRLSNGDSNLCEQSGHGASKQNITGASGSQQCSYPPLPDLDSSFHIQLSDTDADLLQHVYLNSHHDEEGFHYPSTPADEGGFHSDFAAPYNLMTTENIYGTTASAAPQQSETSIGRLSQSQRDAEKDKMLILWKQQGLSYREIKERGSFQEAESTLRGRYRTLTKRKEERLRKPEWTPQDIDHLMEAVSFFGRSKSLTDISRSAYSDKNGTRAHEHMLNKIPWKKVAGRMTERGCYRFGNATVKKKYIDVVKSYRNN